MVQDEGKLTKAQWSHDTWVLVIVFSAGVVLIGAAEVFTAPLLGFLPPKALSSIGGALVGTSISFSLAKLQSEGIAERVERLVSLAKLQSEGIAEQVKQLVEATLDDTFTSASKEQVNIEKIKKTWHFYHLTETARDSWTWRHHILDFATSDVPGKLTTIMLSEKRDNTPLHYHIDAGVRHERLIIFSNSHPEDDEPHGVFIFPHAFHTSSVPPYRGIGIIKTMADTTAIVPVIMAAIPFIEPTTLTVESTQVVDSLKKDWAKFLNYTNVVVTPSNENVKTLGERAEQIANERVQAAEKRAEDCYRKLEEIKNLAQNTKREQ